MEIKARRWLAIWYQCPQCGAQSGNPMLTPTKVHRDFIPVCSNWRCQHAMAVVERCYYTTFAIEPSISFTQIAGTLEKIGPFKVCTIVYPNIRAFRKWVDMRRAELAEQSRQSIEQLCIQQEETAARLKREQEEQALLKEVERIAYKREHAVEMEAEQIVQSLWPEERPHVVDPFEGFNDCDDHPF